VVRRELTRFAAALVLALVVVASLTLLATAAVSRDLTVHEATRRGQIFARSICGPLITPELRQGDPHAAALFTTVMRNRLREGSVRHIRVWEPDGTLMWADQDGLAGRHFTLEPEVRALFGSRRALGAISDVDKPDDPPASRDRGLLEVYAAAEAADGTPVVVETYWSPAALREARASVLRRMMPLTLGALFLFAGPALLLARSLARRVQQARDENAALLHQALRASELERRRIAADLHDGVLQEVGGAVYAMDAMARVVDRDPVLARSLVDEVRGMVHNIGSGLRTTMVDIYPVDLETVGMAGALDGLLEPLLEDGVVTIRHVDPAVDDEDVDDRRLAFRVAREGISNVRRHAGAAHTWVDVRLDGPLLRVSVTDDGRGVPEQAGHDAGTDVPSTADPPTPDGHFGLRLMRDTLASVDGELRVDNRPEGGARLEASFPRGRSRGLGLQGLYQATGARSRRRLRRRPARGRP
jgi:signal transduction histidine kinase